MSGVLDIVERAAVSGYLSVKDSVWRYRLDCETEGWLRLLVPNCESELGGFIGCENGRACFAGASRLSMGCVPERSVDWRSTAFDLGPSVAEARSAGCPALTGADSLALQGQTDEMDSINLTATDEDWNDT